MILQFTSRNIATKKKLWQHYCYLCIQFWSLCIFKRKYDSYFDVFKMTMTLDRLRVIEINFYYLLPKVQTKVQSWTRCWQRQLYCSQTMLLFLVFLLIRNLIPCKYFYLFSKLVPRVYRKIEGRTTERIWKFLLFLSDLSFW